MHAQPSHPHTISKQCVFATRKKKTTYRQIKENFFFSQMSLRFALGLDLSITSPACAIFDLEENKWLHFGFASKQTETGTYQPRENVTVTLFPPIPKATKSTDVERYQYIQNFLIPAISESIPLEMRGTETTQVLIEEYCFKASQMASQAKLHESGGIIKSELNAQGFTNIKTVVNTKWKSQVIGNGRATKLDAVKFAAEHGPCVDFLTLLGIAHESLRIIKDVVTGKTSIVVPCPSQDLADSTLLCMMVFIEMWFPGEIGKNGKRKKPQKPKIVIEQSPQVKAALEAELQKRKLAKRNSVWANTEPKSESRVRKQRKRVESVVQST